MALIVGLALIVYYRKSRIAAVGLLLLSVAGLIATGHNRFFGGNGGQNMMMAFLIVWASVRIVLATCRLQSFGSSRDGATSETKERSISSQILEPSGNSQFTAITSVPEEQRPSEEGYKGCSWNTHSFSKNDGFAQNAYLGRQAEDKESSTVDILFAVLYLSCCLDY